MDIWVRPSNTVVLHLGRQLLLRLVVLQKPKLNDNWMSSGSIVFPSGEWNGRDFGEVFPLLKVRNLDGTIQF